MKRKWEYGFFLITNAEKSLQAEASVCLYLIMLYFVKICSDMVNAPGIRDIFIQKSALNENKICFNQVEGIFTFPKG